MLYTIIALKKTIFVLLVLISITFTAARLLKEPIDKYWNINQVAGLKVLSSTVADVYINNIKVGRTPYEDNKLSPTEHLIKLQAGEGGFWEGKVNLKVGTITVINREIGKDSSDSSGEILTLEKGSGATIISRPDGASVEIDGKGFGKTPGRFEVSSGDHLFVLSHQNYLNRSIKASIPEGFNLNLVVDLSLSEIDLSSITKPTTNTPMVIVKNTPTGFLRLRDKPSLAGVEVARIDEGTELVLLEELNGWFKVKTSDGKEGYVSSQYVTKKPNPAPSGR